MKATEHTCFVLLAYKGRAYCSMHVQYRLVQMPTSIK